MSRSTVTQDPAIDMSTSPVKPGTNLSKAWHALSIVQVSDCLASSSKGLTREVAAARLTSDGPNALTDGSKVSALHLVITQFKSVIIWILIAASVVSATLGEWVDAAAILAIVVLNAGIGFYQEYSAERSIAALKTMTAPHAKVRRDGAVRTIVASEIVVGDVLILDAGDLVAADARLFEANALTCGESALTGESEVSAKQCSALVRANTPLGDRSNMVFMGTSVTAGTGQAMVVATAMDTEIGRIAGLITDAGRDAGTPLQRKLDRLGYLLIWATLAIVALLFGLVLWRGTKVLDLFLTSVSLAVAAMPEGLPAVVTVALAVGVMRMSRHRALVRRLPAVETLGSTTVICTDKTGTLTVGEMTVRALFVAGQTFEVAGQGYGPAGKISIDSKPPSRQQATALLVLASIHLGCNDAHLVEDKGVWTTVGDPTEGALLSAGGKAGADRVLLDKECPKERAFPFDSDRKRSSVVRRMPGGGLRVLSNGAPEALLLRCDRILSYAGVRRLTEQDRTQVLDWIATLSAQALRVLGSAYRDLDDTTISVTTADAAERDMVFVGLSGMYDPPRPEAKEAIVTCRRAGIRVVMITGDHPRTAAAIAHELGIVSDGSPITGTRLDAMSDEDLHRRAATAGVYARVTAAHKLRIVRALKSDRAVVAMTGDGVNDAPAIKGADVGIAMGRTGTEVAKQAADIIITDDDFATIVHAVKEGRGVFDNIRKTLQYLLAGNTGELLVMTVAIGVGLPAPLLPIHLLWINLVTDGLPALCLAADPIDPDVMGRPPRPAGERITNRRFVETMLLTGVLTGGVAVAVFVYVLKSGTLEAARTYAFSVLVFAELLRSFGARSASRSILKVPFLGNLPLVGVVALGVLAQVFIQEIPMLAQVMKVAVVPLRDLLVLLAIGSIPLIALEVAKLVRSPAPC
ncbi:cation-translocating P-type ATPase [Lichenifustis flavocetrariae]|uniref:P-type Cu(+) transporter n=1 Tax=Lichenifustis flavocetrariae TaxID=2949735 RepID=A0AA42CRN0_9HYPH|nr:cation-translocating P-type ATPase [Lichenifustis flavocetrariae]MCW6512662.1 cation-translocating P-type ATPase [Lichenifustis flavocetrariae]